MAQNVGGTAVVSEMSSSDQVIKFLLDNKIQRSVVDEILERGFDSLEALSLLDPEDIKSQKIPVGQRRLLVHVAKSLVIGGTSLQKADHGSQPTPSTSDIVHVQPVVEEQDDVYSQTLINSLVAQQTHLAGNQASGAPPTNNSITPASANLGIDQAQPSWQDPQIHIATATGKSGLSYLDVCDFVPHSVEEELVIGGQGEQQVVVKSGPKKPKLETLSLSQWSIVNLSILYRLTNEGKLVGPALMDYLSYTTKIYQLVQKCNLASVLLYEDLGGVRMYNICTCYISNPGTAKLKLAPKPTPAAKPQTIPSPTIQNLRGKVVSVRTIIVRKVVAFKSANICTSAYHQGVT